MRSITTTGRGGKLSGVPGLSMVMKACPWWGQSLIPGEYREYARTGGVDARVTRGGCGDGMHTSENLLSKRQYQPREQCQTLSAFVGK